MQLSTFRYQRGNRSLASTLGSSTAGGTDSTNTELHHHGEEEEEYDIPEEIEDVIGGYISYGLVISLSFSLTST